MTGAAQDRESARPRSWAARTRSPLSDPLANALLAARVGLAWGLPTIDCQAGVTVGTSSTAHR